MSLLLFFDKHVLFFVLVLRKLGLEVTARRGACVESREEFWGGRSLGVDSVERQQEARIKVGFGGAKEI